MSARAVVEMAAMAPAASADLASWVAGTNVANPDGSPRVVYHGTRERFRNFSKAMAAMGGLTWFTSDRAATAYYGPIVIPLYARLLKPPGWEEYQRLGLHELRREGYDGAILPRGDGQFDGFAFEPRSLRRAPVAEAGHRRQALPESDPTPAGIPSDPLGYASGHCRIEGRKYWIDPDGEAHPCDDHSDWAAEELGLPGDEGDGERAGENVEAAQLQGYADVHTERDTGTGRRFVYVRVPWGRLKKAQREAVKEIAERLAAAVIDDAGQRPVQVYDASEMRTD